MSEWNKLDIFSNDSSQVTEWKDLDDDLYNNHFANGQCKIGVNFYNAAENGGFAHSMNIPCYPEDVTFNGSTNYASAGILGRPGDISGYTGTSDITTRFSMHLHRELIIPGELQTDKNQIDKLVNLIMACNYPKTYQDGMYMPIVTYKFGDTQIVGKQTSFDIKWGGTKIGRSYMECTINLAVTHVFDFIPYFDNINGLVTPRTLP